LQVRLRLTRQPSAITSETQPPHLSSSSVPSNSALGASSLVALGILLSRITGLVRERVTAHYLGNSGVAGVFRAAVRIPNLLNTLFGEGVLSAAFVTVYSKLRAESKNQEAEHLAQATFALLSLVCATVVLAGVIATPLLIDLIAPGFHGSERALTGTIVRILFPGTGMLVMSAWCLGVLNSHRLFLLSYTAPVALNAAMIAAPLFAGMGTPPDRLVFDLAWAFVGGSVLQFLVQLPKVLQILPNFRPVLDVESPHIRTVIRNFGPVFLSRGVVQVSAYVDQMIASFLGTVAVSTLGYAQVISVLPVSLFSMSVSAAELPAMSSLTGSESEVASLLRSRLNASLRRIAFFVVPSAVAFLFLGDVIAATLYQSGRFVHADAVYVWGALGGAAVGLLATSLGRLYSSAFYALLDTRTPLRFAIIRVVLTTVLGYIFALHLPAWLGIGNKWGVAGLTSSAGIAGWVEFLLLRRSLQDRIGTVRIPKRILLKLWLPALTAGTLSWALKAVVGSAHPLWSGIVLFLVFGSTYLGATLLLGLDEARQLSGRVQRLTSALVRRRP
jgi:putative peptidoglycan lipid II flippase